jgi:lysophospholipase L1-like esterase
MESPSPPTQETVLDRVALERLVQFQHPHKLLALAGLPGVASLASSETAALLGTDPARYGNALCTIEDRVRDAAAELAAVTSIADAVRALPLETDDVIVAAGDSLVDDLQSWAEILRVLLEIAGAPNVHVVNAGISGDTTTGLLARFSDVLVLQPRWLVIMIGLNDARRHGDERAPMLLSDAQTAANLRELRRRAITACPDVKLLWVTPAPVSPELIREDEWLRSRDVSWRRDDVAGKARLFRTLPEPVLDLHRVFGARPHPETLLEDGLHLSLTGQRLVTEHLLGLWASQTA